MKRIMQALRLGKIAAVDRPCQEGAVAVITKSAPESFDDSAYQWICKRVFTAEQRRDAAASGAAMKDGSYPIENKSDLENAIHAVGRGKGSHAAIRAHIIRRAKALGASDMVPESWHDGGKVKKALVEAFEKAGLQLVQPDGDECAEDFNELLAEQCLTQQFWDAYYRATSALQASLITIMGDDAADKSALVTQTLQQFADYVESILPSPVGKSLAAGIAAIAGSAGTTDQGDSMSDAIKKALGLPATATEAEVLKAVETEQAKTKKAEECAKIAQSIAKMSAEHKAHYDKLEGDAKERFAAMSSSERDEHMKKSAPVETEAEKQLRKRLDEQAAETAELKKKLADKDQADAIASFAKRSTGIGLKPELGETIFKARGGNAEAFEAMLKAFETEIVALRKQVETGGLFSEIGKVSAQTGTAYAELTAKAAELRKSNPKLTEAQAFAKVFEDKANREIVKRYRAETDSRAAA